MARDPFTQAVIEALEHQFEARAALTGESHYQILTRAGLNRKWFDDLKKPEKSARLDSVYKIATFLRLSVVDLLSGVKDGARPVPLISWVQAGEMMPTEDPYPLGFGETTEHVDWKHPYVFALRVRGPSMNRIADDGDIVFVDYKDREPRDGKLYIFRDTQEHEATFKRWRTNPDRMEPVSFEEEFGPLFPNASTEVVGRVFEVRKRL